MTSLSPFWISMAGLTDPEMSLLKRRLQKMCISHSFIHSCPDAFNTLKSLLVEKCPRLNHLTFRRARFLSEGFLMRLDV